LKLAAMAAVRDLQMPDGEVRRAQRGSDSAEPVIRPGLVEHQITAQDEIEITHFGAPLIVDDFSMILCATMRSSPPRAAIRGKAAPKIKATPAAAEEPVSVGAVVEWIRERIRRGRLVPGQRLVEADIMRELSASRSRVREALQRLSTEGLVTIEEFRGASVKQFSRDEIRQIYRARMALEAQAARDFAESDAADLKRRLASVQQELNALEHTGDHERFARLNDEWHRLIIQGSGNSYIAMFVERLRVPIYRLLFSTFYSAQRIDRANADHRRITEAILAGRGKDAERFMREHIEAGLKALESIEIE
jgi:DNA-binding GntR family transcriptional regulator